MKATRSFGCKAPAVFAGACLWAFVSWCGGGDVQSRIDACAAQGGGRVTLGPGVHESGCLTLRSNVELHLEKGAVLKAPPTMAGYPQRKLTLADAAKVPRWNAACFIFAEGATNVAITGEGTIDANGNGFVVPIERKAWGWRFKRVEGRTPPRVVWLLGCRDVRIEDVTMINQPAGWSYWICDCDNVLVDRITIDANVAYPNNDGVHINSSRDVIVRNSRIECGDDSIVMRANNVSLPANRVCERVVVSNCVLRSYANGIRIGWINDGVIRNGLFKDIRIRKSTNGIGIVLPPPWVPSDVGREATHVENLTFEDIAMDDIYVRPVVCTVNPGKETLFDAITNVTFRNVTSRGLGLPYVSGAPGKRAAPFVYENCRFEKVPREQLDLVGEPWAEPDDVCDVAVVGGGPAGIGAALASARLGASTVLVERDARLGGTTVSAEVLPMGHFYAWKRQIVDGPCWTLVTNAVALAGGSLPDFSRQDDHRWWEFCVRVNPFVYSALAAETLEKAGVGLRFNAAACGMEKLPDGWRIKLATDAGERFLLAKEVIDATGNGAVAAFAGAKRVRTDEADRQPGSYFFRLNTKGMAFDAAAVDRAHAAAVADGSLLASDVHIKMSSYIRNGGGWGCYVPLADNSTAEARAETNRRGRETMLRILRFVRRQPGLEKATVVSAAPEVGVRETYRVVGEKTVTEEAYLNGTVEDDSLCYSYWMIDAHKSSQKVARLRFHEQGKVGAIPLGAMLPKGTTNLLVAGRAVSSDHGANSALRVQASCMAMGQAAGAAAALAAPTGADPRTVDVVAVKRALRDMGAIVP